MTQNDGAIFIMAEVGQAHDGSLGILHSYIDAVARTGVNAIKFQTHLAEAESSPFEPFRVNFSYEDASRFDYWQRVSFTPEQWQGIKDHCNAVGLEFMSSPFSVAAVLLLESLGMARYKIGSGEVGNLLMLERIGRLGKPVLLSSGMSGFAELDEAVALLASHRVPLTLMQCTTRYPTPPEAVGLNVLAQLAQRYHQPVGLSDHSGEIFACLAAAALGAACLEVHVVFDKRMFGPDSAASLTIDQLTRLVQGVRALETMRCHPVDKEQDGDFTALKRMFGKSLAVNRDLPRGHCLTLDDLESKKPAERGIPARDFMRVVGRRLAHPLPQWAFLQEGDLE